MSDSNPVEVDVNADDQSIDDFEATFFNRKEEAPKAKVEEEVVPVVTDDDATDEEPEEAPEADEPEEQEESEDSETPEDEPEEEGEEEDIFQPKKSNRKTAQERISELTTARREAERERDALMARIAALEARQSQKEPEPEAKPARQEVDPDAPHPMDVDANGELKYPLGEFDPQFVADYTRHTIRKETALARQEEQQLEAQRREQEHQTRLQEGWQEKLETAEQDFEDLRPVIASLEGQLREVQPEYGTYLAQTIMQMEVGPQVLYYLAKHPSEANKIIAAGPVQATLMLGKLEAKVEQALTKKPEKAAPVRMTKAPEPAVATRGVGARESVRGDTDNQDAFEKAFFKRK